MTSPKAESRTGTSNLADDPAAIVPAMSRQAMVNQFAKLAEPRLVELLRIRVRHVFEMTPGRANSSLVVEGIPVQFTLFRTTQPYKDIERFLADDKVIGFVVNPGVLPIVKTITQDTRGRKLLVTRRIQAADYENSLVAHFEHFGMRVVMSFDEVLDETQVAWECLYAVA
jgi:hypothetical protein